jgi:DNA invertase Pin-like site-specific DNA recombinase
MEALNQALRLVAYTRLSQANQHEGESHAAQLDRITSWAGVAGHEVIAQRSDTISGENGPEDRPGFLDALNMLDEHLADGVAVSSLDRLARKLATQEALLATVWRRDAVVFEVGMGEVAQDDPDDPYRTFVRQVMGAAAQLERALIVKRMADGRRRAVRQGRSIGPAPSFGWMKDPDDPGRVIPDPATFPLVEKIVRLLHAGATLAAAGAVLEERTGRRWQPTQVARIRDRFERYGHLLDS